MIIPILRFSKKKKNTFRIANKYKNIFDFETNLKVMLI